MTDKTPANDQADKDWADLQRDLDTLGEQLGSLRSHTAALGETLVADLEARFQDVRNRSLTFRNATETQLETLRQQAMQQASEAGAKSAEIAKDTARQMWERSEPLRQGAQEVGQGLVRAWSEIAASFGKAADKYQQAAAQKRTETSTGEEGHTPS
ncbi:MAG: hypothetical protein ACRECX_01055 [Methyloceanibacter sp.]|uniref:hypothetical protein n=1 Tax=Methyloceanibacter sp. TaxID=1965321 RepID=UPI003D6D6F33